MAKIYAPPAGIEMPVLDYKNYNATRFKAVGDKYLADLAAWCRSRWSGDLVGEVITTPYADSCAIYMVARQRPFWLFHLPLGDAWRADEIWERGIRLIDARKIVERDRELKKLFETA